MATSSDTGPGSSKDTQPLCDLCNQAPATRQCNAKQCPVRVCAACTHGVKPFVCAAHGGPGPSAPLSAKGKTPAALADLVKDLEEHGFVLKKEVSLQSPIGKTPTGAAELLGTVVLEPQTMASLFADHPEMQSKAARELERYKVEVLGKETLEQEVQALKAALKAKKQALAALAGQKRSRVTDAGGAATAGRGAKKAKVVKNLAPAADDYPFGDQSDGEDDEGPAVQGMRALSAKGKHKATPAPAPLRIGPGAARARADSDDDDAASDQTPPVKRTTATKAVTVPPPPLTVEQKAAFKYTTRVVTKDKVFAAVSRQMEATGTVVMTALLEDLKLPAGAGKPLRAWYAGVADKPLPFNPPGRPAKVPK